MAAEITASGSDLVEATTRAVKVEALPAEWSAWRISTAFIDRRWVSDGSAPVIMRSIMAAWDSPSRGAS